MVVAKERLRRVLITGAESTGKSTLAATLARHYRTSWCPEYLREYFDSHGGKLRFEDQLKIARERAAREEIAARGARGVLFVDTSALSTVAYSRLYFGKVDPGVEEILAHERYDLILLLHTDVPWTEDPQRDRPGDRRRIHKDLIAEMGARGLAWVDVLGDWERRSQIATGAVDELLRTETNGPPARQTDRH